jgi:hypothetical protein
MSTLRLVLIVANAVFLAWLAYVFATLEGRQPHDAQFWLGYGILTCLALNLVYLLLHQAGLPKWRIFRLISLWFDAKESELRQRANKSRQSQ